MSNSDDMDELKARIRALEVRMARQDDLEAIRTLRCTYHDYVNQDRAAELADLFSENATVIYGGRPAVTGRDAIGAFFLDLPVKWARQFIHAHVVEIDGDCGRGYSHLDGRPVVDGKSLMVGGRFDDEYVRERGRWLFSRVVLTIWYAIPVEPGWESAAIAGPARTPITSGG
ncbi:MAG: nuclear transport factor 2 family protein [Caulobacterales bacterium]|nr:nuclear transport factor 2 family protein [Caulobacterales bacterium]